MKKLNRAELESYGWNFDKNTWDEGHSDEELYLFEDGTVSPYNYDDDAVAYMDNIAGGFNYIDFAEDFKDCFDEDRVSIIIGFGVETQVCYTLDDFDSSDFMTKREFIDECLDEPEEYELSEEDIDEISELLHEGDLDTIIYDYLDGDAPDTRGYMYYLDDYRKSPEYWIED